MYGGLERAGDEGVGEVAHPQGRHHVFEHRACPGEKGRATFDEDVGAVEAEPGLLGDVAFGDGDEGGDAGLGGEEVVAGGVELVSGTVVADGEELAGFDEEEAVLHDLGVTLRVGGDPGQVRFELGETLDGCGEEGSQLRGRGGEERVGWKRGHGGCNASV